MLQKDPDDRYQTPDDVRADLRLVAAGKWKSADEPEAAPIPTTPEGPAKPKYDIRTKTPRRLRRRRRRR